MPTNATEHRGQVPYEGKWLVLMCLVMGCGPCPSLGGGCVHLLFSGVGSRAYAGQLVSGHVLSDIRSVEGPGATLPYYGISYVSFFSRRLSFIGRMQSQPCSKELIGWTSWDYIHSICTRNRSDRGHVDIWTHHSRGKKNGF